MMYSYSAKSTSVKKLSTKKLAATDISNSFLHLHLSSLFPLELQKRWGTEKVMRHEMEICIISVTSK